MALKLSVKPAIPPMVLPAIIPGLMGLVFGEEGIEENAVDVTTDGLLELVCVAFAVNVELKSVAIPALVQSDEGWVSFAEPFPLLSARIWLAM